MVSLYQAIAILKPLAREYADDFRYVSELARTRRYTSIAQHELVIRDVIKRNDSGGREEDSAVLTEVKEAAAILEKRLTESITLSDQVELGELYEFLGWLSSEQEESMQWREKSVRLYRQLVDENPAIVEYRQSLALAYLDLSLVQASMFRGPRSDWKREEALESVRKSIRNWQQLKPRTPGNITYLLGLSSSYMQLGDLSIWIPETNAGKTTLRTNLDDRGEARAAYEKSIDYLERVLAEDPDRSLVRRYLTAVFDRLKFCIIGSDPIQHEVLLRRAVEHHRQLIFDNPDVPRYAQAPLASTPCAELGSILAQNGKPGEAIVYLKESLEIWRKMEEDPRIRPRLHQRRHAYRNLSSAQRDVGELEESITSRTEAIKIQTQLLKLQPNNANIRRRQMVDYLECGKTQSDVGREHEAAASWRSVIQLGQSFPSQKLDPSAPASMGKAFYHLGRLKEAEDAMEQYLEVVGMGPQHHLSWYLVMTRHKLGETEKARSEYDRLVAEFDKNPIPHQASLRAEAAKVLGIEEPLKETEEAATE